MTDKQPIDVVVTYVDDRDEVWRTALSGFDVEYSASRWRSWDILRFWLRGVAQFMPWAGTVYLVVSNAEQVPAYVDRNSVDVVLHEDIIPKRLLPTFNSATIEMFLHRIPRLSERFVYSNDDMLPMQLLDQSDFFKDGLPVLEKTFTPRGSYVFKRHCANSFALAKKLSGADSPYFCTKHNMAAMLKSACIEVSNMAEDEILGSCTKFREPWNLNQYLFTVYSLLTGRAVEGKQSSAYFNTSDANELIEGIKSSECKLVCVNDNCPAEEYDARMLDLRDVLSGMFPVKSKYEV